MLAEVIFEYQIERGKIARILQPYAAAHHVLRAISHIVENRQKIYNGDLRLCGDVPVTSSPLTIGT